VAKRLYPHNEAHNLAGTFPAGEQDAQAADFTATGANTLKGMNASIGLSMAYLEAVTAATVSNQAGFMGMWTTAPLDGDQTVGGASETLTVNVGDYESSANANFCINRVHAYVWRPSTGAIVGDLCTYATAPSSGSPAEPTAESSIQVTTFVVDLASVSALSGDVLVVELWANLTQATASSYAVRAYYDGTVENTTENAVVTDHATFFEFSQNLVFSSPEVRLTGHDATVFYESTLSPELRLTGHDATVFYESTLSPEVRLTGHSAIVWYVPPPPPIDLEGSATDEVSATGDLSTSIDMAGQAADQVTATGNILTAISFEGHAEAHTEAHAELTQKKLFKFVINHVGVKGDIDFDTQAARRFYGEVRKFAERTKPWKPAIFYETHPDEIWDLTLVSQRVYGRRDEYLAVMAAAGIDSVDQPLKQKRLVLPTEQQLNLIKRRTGFESIADLREDRKPVWLN
jgi:hypothetical protein